MAKAKTNRMSITLVGPPKRRGAVQDERATRLELARSMIAAGVLPGAIVQHLDSLAEVVTTVPNKGS